MAPQREKAKARETKEEQTDAGVIEEPEAEQEEVVVQMGDMEA